MCVYKSLNFIKWPATNMLSSEELLEACMYKTYFTGGFLDDKPLGFSIDGKDFVGCGGGYAVR